jgi:hypothetical protein
VGCQGYGLRENEPREMQSFEAGLGGNAEPRKPNGGVGFSVTVSALGRIWPGALPLMP